MLVREEVQVKIAKPPKSCGEEKRGGDLNEKIDLQKLRRAAAARPGRSGRIQENGDLQMVVPIFEEGRFSVGPKHSPAEVEIDPGTRRRQKNQIS